MKIKKTLGLFALASLFSFSLVGLEAKENHEEANLLGSTTLSSVDNYYKSLDTNLKGQPFIDDLSNIINNGAKIGNYKDAYTRLCDTDEDPNNKKNIRCFYTDVSYPKGTSGTNRKWNREHVWAKSHGFPSEGMKAHCDIHHLRATEMKINSTRSNLDFDEVENHKGKVSQDNYGNKWIGGVCFEPRDEVKGDVARMMFYMVTMYNGHNGTSLELHNHIPSNNKSTGHGEFGGLDTLIKWHQEDPVDGTERRRNEVIYGYQNNRNPYIDHPEYVGNAFNVEITLPDEPDKPVGPEVNEYTVAWVQGMIDALPEVVTLDDATDIENAKAGYDTLNEAEKKLIKNYNKLEEALRALEELTNPSPNPNPDPEPKPEPDIEEVISESLTIDTTKHNIDDHPYTPNYRMTIDNHKFEASWAGVTRGELRIGDGHNRAVPSKYKINANGAALVSKFKVEGLTKLSLDLAKNYGDLHDFYLFIENNGELQKIQKVDLNKKENDRTIDIEFAEPKNGYLHFVFTGKEARAVLGDIRLSIGDNIINPDPKPVDTSVQDSFVKEESKSRLSVSYKTIINELNGVKLHIGGKISKASYDKDSSYGVVYLDSNVNLSAGVLANASKISDSFNENQFKLIKPRQEDPQGNIFEIDLILDVEDYNKEFNVAMFIERDGKVYLSKPAKISVKSTMERYINDSSIANNPKYIAAVEALKNYLNK